MQCDGNVASGPKSGVSSGDITGSVAEAASKLKSYSKPSQTFDDDLERSTNWFINVKEGFAPATIFGKAVRGVDALTEIYRATWGCYYAHHKIWGESLFDKSIGSAFLLVDCKTVLVLLKKFQWRHSSVEWFLCILVVCDALSLLVNRGKFFPLHFYIFHFNFGVDTLAKIYCSPYWTLTQKASHKIRPFNNIKCIAMSTSLVQIKWKCMRPFSL